MRTLYGLAVALLAIFALTGCSPRSGEPADQLALQQVLRAAVRDEMAIDAATLADRLLSNPEGLALFDLRPDAEFAQNHLETATRRGPTDLLTAELPPARDLILYDADGALAAQTAAVLRLDGHERIYYLRGGYAGWKDYLAGNGQPTDGGVQAARDQARRTAIACRFEGDYVATAGLVPRTEAAPGGGYAPTTRPATPAPAAPADSLGLGLDLGLGPEQSAPRPRGRLKIGEGC